MDDSKNPFASAAAATATPRFHTPQPGTVFGLFDNFRGAPTQQEYEAGEARSIRDEQRAVAAGEREALSEIVGLINETRAANPGAPSHILSKQIFGSEKFTRNALRIPANKMTPFINDILGMIATPEATKPTVLSEGQAAFDSKTGQQLFNNPKAAEPDPYTKEARVAAARQGVGQMDKLAEAGAQARVDAIALDELDNLIGTATKSGRVATGMGAALKGYLGRVGIAVEGTDDVQSLEALIDRMVPAARQGLPGAASDRDVQMFRSSLPSLTRTPEGNREIVKRLRALNNHALKQADVAEQIFSGELTLPQGFAKLRGMRPPLEGFKPAAQSDPSLTSPKLQAAPVMRIRRAKGGGLEEYSE